MPGWPCVKLAQVDFLRNEATSWTQDNKINFAAFVWNLMKLAKPSAGAGDGVFRFMFAGADGVVEAHEQKAIDTAKKLVIQAAMRRYGFWGALFFWKNVDEENLHQLFIAENDEELRKMKSREVKFKGAGTAAIAASRFAATLKKPAGDDAGESREGP